jgi:hypothetical protein
MKNGRMLLIGLIGLILTGFGIADLLATNPYYIYQGEDKTISYYLIIGILLLVLSIVGFIRGNRRIK